jgi:hypothetical protein
MQTHAERNHGTPGNADLKRQRGGASTLNIVSNRPEAIAQRKLQEMAKDSPQVQRLKAAQDMADASPQVQQAMGLVPQPKPFGSMSGKTAQLEIAPEEEELLQGKFQTLQRQSLEEEEPLQGKFDSIQRMEPEEEELQMKQGVRSGSATQLEADPAPGSNDTGLPDSLKSGIESLSGMSMDNVKVHYNSAQPAQLNALAYAQGTDIHVAPGQEQHLPHEAWHVVQQAQGRVKPTVQMKDGVPVNDDAGLEHEADVMGAKALVQGVPESGEPKSAEPRPGKRLLTPAATPKRSGGAREVTQRRIKLNGQDVVLGDLLKKVDDEKARLVLANWGWSPMEHDFVAGSPKAAEAKLFSAVESAKTQEVNPPDLYRAANLKFLTKAGGRLPTLYFSSGNHSGRIRQQHGSGPAVIDQMTSSRASQIWTSTMGRQQRRGKQTRSSPSMWPNTTVRSIRPQAVSIWR